MASSSSAPVVYSHQKSPEELLLGLVLQKLDVVSERLTKIEDLLLDGAPKTPSKEVDLKLEASPMVSGVPWRPNQFYAEHSLVFDEAGRPYLALRDNKSTKEPAAQPNSWCPVEHFCARWRPQATYSVGDVVVFAGEYFRCHKTHRGHSPLGVNDIWLPVIESPSKEVVVPKTASDAKEVPSDDEKKILEWTGKKKVPFSPELEKFVKNVFNASVLGHMSETGVLARTEKAVRSLHKQGLLPHILN